MSENWQLQNPDLRSRAAYLYETKLYSDCEFKVGTKTLSAHKLIMAMASPVFAKMLYAEVRKKTSRTPIEVPQIRYEVFRKILKYIYTDVLNIHSNHEALDLYEAAKMLKLTYVSMICVKYLSLHMEPGSVCDIYKVALEARDPGLQKACKKIFCTKTKEILNHENFLKVDVNTVEQLFSLEPLNIDHEMDLFNALVKYTKSQQKKSVASNERVSDDNDDGSESDIFGEEKICDRPNRRHSNASQMSYTDSEQDSNDEDEVPNYHVILKQIRFLTFTPREFANNLTSLSLLLSPKEIFLISMKICSMDSPLTMPDGFSLNMVPRTLVGLEERSKPAIVYRSIIRGFKNLHQNEYESETFFYRNMGWIFRIMPHQDSLLFFVECLHSSSLESLKKTIIVVLKFYSVIPGIPDKEFHLQYSKMMQDSNFFLWSSKTEKSYLLNKENGFIDVSGAITYKVHIFDKVRLSPNVAYSVTSNPSDTSLRISSVKQSESCSSEKNSLRILSYRDFMSPKSKKDLELEVTTNMAKLNRSFVNYSKKRSLKRLRTKSATVASTKSSMCTVVPLLYKIVQSNPSCTNLSVIQSIKKPRLSIKEISSSIADSTEQSCSSNFSNSIASTITGTTLPMSETKSVTKESNAFLYSNCLSEISRENITSPQQKGVSNNSVNDLIRAPLTGTVIVTNSISVSLSSLASVSNALLIDSLSIKQKSYLPPRTKSFYSYHPLHARTIPWPTKYINSKTNSIASSQSRVTESVFIQKKMCSSPKSPKSSVVRPPKSSHPKKQRNSDIDHEHTQTKRCKSNLEYLDKEMKIDMTDVKTDVNDCHSYSKEEVAVPYIEMHEFNISCVNMQMQPKMLKDITTTKLNSLMSSSNKDNNYCMNVKCLDIVDRGIMTNNNILCDLHQLNNNHPKTLKGISVDMINHITSKSVFNSLYKNLKNMECSNDIEDVTIGVSGPVTSFQTNIVDINAKTQPKSLKDATMTLLNTIISNKDTYQYNVNKDLKDSLECYDRNLKDVCLHDNIEDVSIRLNESVTSCQTHIVENNTKTLPKSLKDATMVVLNTMISNKDTCEYHIDKDLKDSLEYFNKKLGKSECSNDFEDVRMRLNKSFSSFQTHIVDNNNKTHPKSLKYGTMAAVNSMILNKDAHENSLDNNFMDGCLECFNNNLKNVEYLDDIDDVTIRQSQFVTSFQTNIGTKTQPKSLKDSTIAVKNTMISNNETYEYHIDKDLKESYEYNNNNLKNVSCANNIEDVKIQLNKFVPSFQRKIVEFNANSHPESLKDVTIHFLNTMISENMSSSQLKSLKNATIAFINTMISNKVMYEYHVGKAFNDGLECFIGNSECSNDIEDVRMLLNESVTLFQSHSVEKNIKTQPKPLKDATMAVLNYMISNKEDFEYYIDENLIEDLECYNNNLENMEWSNDIENVKIGLSESETSFQRKNVENDAKSQIKFLKDATMTILNTNISEKNAKSQPKSLTDVTMTFLNTVILENNTKIQPKSLKDATIALLNTMILKNNTKTQLTQPKSLKGAIMVLLNTMIFENNAKTALTQPKSLKHATMGLLNSMISNNETYEYHLNEDLDSDRNSQAKHLAVRSCVTAKTYFQPRTLKEITLVTVVNDLFLMKKYSFDYYLEDLRDIVDVITNLGENDMFQPASLMQVALAILGPLVLKEECASAYLL